MAMYSLPCPGLIYRCGGTYTAPGPWGFYLYIRRNVEEHLQVGLIVFVPVDGYSDMFNEGRVGVPIF
jgi:hypothetical protein